MTPFGHSPRDSQALLEPPQLKANVGGCMQEFPQSCEAIVPGKQAWDAPLAGRYATGTAALTPATSSAAEGSVTSDLDPREERADWLLRIFRDQFAIHIPYVIISPDDTCQELQSNRPWVFRTVLMLAGQDERSRQIEQGMQLARDILEAMLIRGEKSLDMLQALLVYNTWCVTTIPFPFLSWQGCKL